MHASAFFVVCTCVVKGPVQGCFRDALSNDIINLSRNGISKNILRIYVLRDSGSDKLKFATYFT